MVLGLRNFYMANNNCIFGKLLVLRWWCSHKLTSFLTKKTKNKYTMLTLSSALSQDSNTRTSQFLGHRDVKNLWAHNDRIEFAHLWCPFPQSAWHQVQRKISSNSWFLHWKKWDWGGQPASPPSWVYLQEVYLALTPQSIMTVWREKELSPRTARDKGRR